MADQTGRKPVADYFRGIISEIENSDYNPNFTREYSKELLHLFGDLTYINAEEKETSVDVIYGSPERAVGKRDEKTTLVLPLVSLVLNSFDADEKRQKYEPLINFETSFNKEEQRHKRVVSKLPKPIKLNYTLTIYGKFIEDLNQVYEKIETRFNPSIEIPVSFDPHAKAFITNRRESTQTIAGDREDRQLKRSVTFSIEAYVPSERFLVTNTGEATFELEAFVDGVKDLPLTFEDPVKEELDQILTYSDGYRTYYDVRYPTYPDTALDENERIPVVFMGHGGGSSRWSQRGKAYSYARHESFIVVTFDIRGQGSSFDALNDNRVYGRKTPVSWREQMDMYELMRQITFQYRADKRDSGEVAVAANPAKIAWAGFSQGGAYSLAANCLSEKRIPIEVVNETEWADIITNEKYTSETKFPRIQFTSCGGIWPSLDRLASNYGYTLQQSYVRSHYQTNTPNWVKYLGGAGAPPYDPRPGENNVIWVDPTLWIQTTNLLTSSTGGVGVPDNIWSTSALNVFFNGLYTGSTGTPSGSDSSSFRGWQENMFESFIQSTVPVLYQVEPNDVFETINSTVDVFERRRTEGSGDFFVRFGAPGHGLKRIHGEKSKYNGLERAFLRKYLKGIDFPDWYYANSLDKNRIVARIKPNYLYEKDRPAAIRNTIRDFGWLYDSDGIDWKYFKFERESLRPNQRILDFVDGAATGKSTSAVFYCSGGGGTGVITSATPASAGSSQYVINHSLSSGFDLSSYFEIASNPNTPDLDRGGDAITQNFGPSQLIASGLINTSGNVSAGYTSEPWSSASALCGSVEVLLHASADTSFILGATLWDLYTGPLGEARQQCITGGYLAQPHPTRAQQLNTYIFNLGTDFFPLLEDHKLRLVIEAYPWARHPKPSGRNKGGVLRPGMYFHNFNATIAEYPASGAIVNTIDQIPIISSLDKGEAFVPQIFDWMRITLPVMNAFGNIPGEEGPIGHWDGQGGASGVDGNPTVAAPFGMDDPSTPNWGGEDPDSLPF